MHYYIAKSFTGLNDYTDSNRTSKYSGSSVKKRETNDVARMLMCKPKVKEYPIKVMFTWLINNRGKDLDNVSFAKKYILDGMCKAGIIKNDNLTKIIAFEDKVIMVKDKSQQGVLVSITEGYKEVIDDGINKILEEKRGHR